MKTVIRACAVLTEKRVCTGKFTIRCGPRFADVLWNVDELDALPDLSDNYLCGTPEQSRALYAAMNPYIRKDPASYAQGDMRWGGIYSIEYQAMPAVIALVTNAWTDAVGACMAGKGPRLRRRRSDNITAFCA